MPEIVVRSNVARDILNAASDFGNVPKMIVEYVSNGLDNPNQPGQRVTVRVTTPRSNGAATRTVRITDDGSGMDDEGLERFFVMHAENAQRQRGCQARGRFGTGKSAGFGVGTALHIDTVRNGRRWMVELTLGEVEAAGKADREPRPAVHMRGEPTDLPNGTTVTVTGVRKRARTDYIEAELRRRLGRQLERHHVFVGSERVRLIEPDVADTWYFRSRDYPPAANALGDDIVCTVAAVAPGRTVDEAIRGVSVTSCDVPVAQYEASGDLSARIFGSVEVPALDADTSTPGPFNDSRDLRLNTDNLLAGAIDSWVRNCLSHVTKELKEQERERRRKARTEELARAASQAESVLNDHYRSEFRTLSGTGRTGGATTTPGSGRSQLTPDESGEAVLPDPDGTSGYEPTPSTPTEGLHASEKPAEPAESAADSERSAQPKERDPLANGRGNPVTQLPRQRQRRSSGGFHIEYSNNGPEAPRAAYYRTDLTIVINLDHPLLTAVASDHDLFQGLAFTIAAEEYVHATANALLDEGTLEDAFEALQYMRATMDKLSRAFASADVFSILADSTSLRTAR